LVVVGLSETSNYAASLVVVYAWWMCAVETHEHYSVKLSLQF